MATESTAPGPIFVVGAPRSGTSLLRQLLNRHPAIALCGESYFFYYVFERRAAFGDPPDPAVRARIVERYLATRQVAQLGLDREALAAALTRDGDSYPALFLALLRHYAAAHGKRRCGEKTPGHALHAEALLSMYPTARLLHIVRDPRDVVESLSRMPWAPQSPLANARAWRRHVGAAGRCAADPRYRLVRYEDLVQDPGAALAALCAFLGEPFDGEMLEAGPRSEAPEWWFARAQGDVSPARSGRWRRTLDAETVALVEWLLGAEMADYGYVAAAAPPGSARLARALADEAREEAARRLRRLPTSLRRWLRPTDLAAEEASGVVRWRRPVAAGPEAEGR
jgi:hypothetical protein